MFPMPPLHPLRRLAPRPLAVLASFAGPLLHADEPLPFRNPDLPVDQRVDDLLSRLTLEEKISQTMMGSADIPRLDIPKYD